jgi:hypothetical protein
MQSLALCSISILCAPLWLDALRREFLPRSEKGVSDGLKLDQVTDSK